MFMSCQIRSVDSNPFHWTSRGKFLSSKIISLSIRRNRSRDYPCRRTPSLCAAPPPQSQRNVSSPLLAGTGGRFAGSYTCLPAGKVWQSRNKPTCIEMAKRFHRLYKEDSERGSTCVHETVWPATPADDGDYVEIPMDSIDYLRGEMKPRSAVFFPR